MFRKVLWFVFLAFVLGDMTAFTASVMAGDREDTIAVIHVQREFDDVSGRENYRLITEKKLASPNAVPAFDKFLSNLQRQLFGNYKGSQKHKTILIRRLDQKRARLLKAVTKLSNEAQQAALAVRCWAKKGRYVRKTGNADLEIAKVARYDSSGNIYTLVTLAVTNTTNTKILKPRNQLGPSTPIGTSMVDSFGNRYKLWKVRPGYLGNEGYGIRPGKTKVFELQFFDEPLRNAKSVRISVESGAYGQNQAATFDIPAEIFFCGMAKK